MKQKFPYLLLICASLGVIVLISLGIWQIQRLGEKENLLTKIEATLSTEGSKITLQDLQNIPPSDKAKQHFFKKVSIQNNGGFKRGLDIAVGPKPLNSKIGVEIFTPWVENNIVLWVKQGWVENNAAFGNGNMYTAKQVSGVLKYPPRSNIFTPANESQNNQWFIANPEEMSAAIGLGSFKTLPLILVRDDIDETSKVTATLVTLNIRNDHLQYAIFWFVMAGALAVISGIKIRKS